MKTRFYFLFTVLAIFAGVHQAAAQGTTAFTYQGQLHDNGTNANGTYAMIFKLYDAATSGNSLGTNTSSPTLANGLFSVNLDFGNVFNGAARWLDITITNGGVTQTLSPRVQVLPTPYTQFAAVAATVTNGAIMNSQLAGNAVNTTNIASGQVVKMLNGLTDSVTLAAGANVALATNGNTLSVSVPANPLSVGNWTAANGSINGFANVLFFSQSGSSRVVIAPTGIADGTGSGNFGMQVTDNLHVSGNVYANGILLTSDRNAKENFTAMDGKAVLAKVVGLPITEWNYRDNAAEVRHLGPMAQDFHSAFGLDGSDDKHISVVDESGVALAAIQGLNEKLKAQDDLKDTEIKALEKRLSDLEHLVKASAQK